MLNTISGGFIVKRLIFVILSIISFNFIFAAGGTIPAGLPTVFGFGAIDKSDSYAASTPHFYKGTTAGTCWDYSYAYLTSDFSASGYGWHNGFRIIIILSHGNRIQGGVLKLLFFLTKINQMIFYSAIGIGA